MTNKQQLRQQILAQLKNQPAAKKKQQETVLYQKLFADPFWQMAKVLGITMSMPHELATLPIIAQALKQSKKVLVPRVAPKRKLLWFEYQPQNFKKSAYGILEPCQPGEQAINPAKIDLLIVPGVGFQLDGTRIGYGGGYYDRLLTDFPGQTLALAFQIQLISGIVPDQWDQKVKRIIY
ncbi:5-formyltetrahydrofolate cyclo-ligase [Liquorilactobacillus sicerae]|uniref:5-formyltetrahydrofolate cyclo-ligase n=1 Tax=Liquorilactobacillus sicerae TaxID=1416943 RepID=UPI002480411A|nr:5-formyltetrahydrofolate cyclo-ligase [Liquorilactobacillus sicerae]